MMCIGVNRIDCDCDPVHTVFKSLDGVRQGGLRGKA